MYGSSQEAELSDTPKQSQQQQQQAQQQKLEQAPPHQRKTRSELGNLYLETTGTCRSLQASGSKSTDGGGKRSSRHAHEPRGKRYGTSGGVLDVKLAPTPKPLDCTKFSITAVVSISAGIRGGRRQGRGEGGAVHHQPTRNSRIHAT